MKELRWDTVLKIWPQQRQGVWVGLATASLRCGKRGLKHRNRQDFVVDGRRSLKFSQSCGKKL